MDNSWKIETLAVQAGYSATNGEPRVTPICQSTTYRYENSHELADLFDLKQAGHIYSRISNPTVEAFEKKICTMEGGKAAVATSSGQAANALAILNCCPCGGHVLAVGNLYGGTVNLFRFTLERMGISVNFVAPDDSIENIKKQIKPNTKVIFGETLANPALRVLDFAKFAMIAQEVSVPFIVDNSFASPYLCRPLEFGANIVTHSSSKYIDGHATSVGGIVIDGGNFDWSQGDFSDFTTPDPTYHGIVYNKDFKDAPFAAKLRAQLFRDLGACMAPLNAFLSNVGAETLHLRMLRHSENALALAQFFASHSKVAWVKYPGLKSDNDYQLANKYLPRGCSGVLCFGVKGGAAAGEKFMNSLKLAAIVVHVADLRTSVLHPASTTHRQLDAKAQEAAGISPDLLRVSVGLENIEDIIADVKQALELV